VNDRPDADSVDGCWQVNTRFVVELQSAGGIHPTTGARSQCCVEKLRLLKLTKADLCVDCPVKLQNKKICIMIKQSVSANEVFYPTATPSPTIACSRRMGLAFEAL